MKPTTTIEQYFATASRRGTRTAFRWHEGGSWRESTWEANARTVRRIARALIALGLQPKGCLVVLAPNRPEWVLAAFGAQAAGGVPVGIYTTSTAEQCAYIVGHSEAKVAVVHDRALAAKLLSQKAALPALETIVLMSGATEGPGVLSWADFLAKGDATPEAEVDARRNSLQRDDTATLIYTSGTTGTPKAAMLSHANVLDGLVAISAAFGLSDDGETVVSYLPFSHIAEQIVSLWGHGKLGTLTGFCEDLEQLGDALREIRPTVFFAVPRVWEKMQAKMVAAGAQNPWLRKKIAAWARGVGLRANLARIEGRPLPGGYGLASKLVFSKVRERLGLDRCRLAVSGAAALPRATLDFFLSLDVPILELYGMTEGLGVATTNTPTAFRPGTTGKSLAGYQLELAADGEILMKGPHVFKGYFKDPVMTAEALDADGWLHSGDIGELDADGFLRITDRKKELFKTAGGKYIAPQHLEGLLKGIPGIGQAVVVGGDDRKYVAALLTLDPESAPRLASTLGAPAELAALSAHPGFVAHVQRELDRINEKLARYESIKRFKLLPRELSVDGGELTPTLKLKRKVIAQKYAADIEALFSGEPPSSASSAA
ncbi:MAG: long-chain fatty acid--CoA ligase [Myxococcaceae bacterium]|nr:long-chain fatty acid--CoA ligase [Myxococcaceae bacterium]